MFLTFPFVATNDVKKIHRWNPQR